MSRPWHVLKRNARSETAHNLIFVDTETKPETLPDGSERDWLWFGWVCVIARTSQGTWGPRRWRRFTTVAQFWKIVGAVVRPKTRWFMFCHNTSYDVPVLDALGAPQRRGWKLEGAVIEAPPTIITLTKDHAKLVILDTLNWWRMALEILGERLDLPKLQMPSPEAPKEDWDAYCRRDVEVLVVTVTRWLAFLKDNDLGGFAPTLAAQCFRTFRHRFMSHEIVIDGDEASHKLSREAYHGGRVSCFALGHVRGPVTYLDINQMYPSVMRLNDYPTRLLGVYPDQDTRRWPKLVRNYCIVARCTVRASEPCYPKILDHRLDFPLGEFETTLATPEIRLALSRGELLAMRDIAVYAKAPIFTDYVTFMSGRRIAAQRAGDEVEAWLFKHMGTNLYGKFGQTGMVYESSDQISDLRARKFEIVDYATRRVLKCRQLGGLLQVMASEGEARDSFPAIAAHVTSYARVLLWEFVGKAGRDHVLYTDTDSLFVDACGAHNLRNQVSPHAVGKLKVVKEFVWMHIHGPKDYTLPTHQVTKGIRKNAELIAPNTYRQTQWSSLKGLVELGDLTAPRRKQVVKVLARKLTAHKKPAA